MLFLEIKICIAEFTAERKMTTCEKSLAAHGTRDCTLCYAVRLHAVALLRCLIEYIILVRVDVFSCSYFRLK